MGDVDPELAALLKRSWAHLHAAQTSLASASVVTPSVPILYFGNLPAYQASPLRVVTVGLNPSRDEFSASDPWQRFPTLEPPAFSREAERHAAALDAYFETVPYRRWFGHPDGRGGLEPILRGLGASFYADRAGRPSRALHTDLCSPLATDPTWSGLDGCVQAVLEHGKNGGVALWSDLVRYLCPDVILVSVAEAHTSTLQLRQGPWSETNGLEDEKRVRHRWARVDDSTTTLVVFGRAAQKPFGFLSCVEKVALGEKVLSLLQGQATLHAVAGDETPRAGPRHAPVESAGAEPDDPPLSTRASPPDDPVPPPRNPPQPESDGCSLAAEPTLYASLAELEEALTDWVEHNQAEGDRFRLDARDAPGGGRPLVGFRVEGFEAEDYADENHEVTGLGFNTEFALAGDTQKRAIEHFLERFRQTNGDPRRIFTCCRSRGPWRSLKLALRPPVPGWQCLSDERRLEQLRARL